jgi:dihydrofolate synthase / folylpolyglutamate synthase
MSAYAETLAWLYGLDAARGMDFKLERVALALAALGDPQRQYPCLHIAGTNGKGSVAAMLHAMLLAAGRRPGLYTSPHLVRFTERIRLGAEDITENEVVELTREIRTAATVRGIELTFFEFITVLAFLAFARHRVDSAVVEVGLGGRLDATNVVDPEVSIITTIALDHEQYLGDTIESIAAEKGGIIKHGRPVVLGRTPDTATEVLQAIAKQRSAAVIEASRAMRAEGQGSLDISGLGWNLAGVALALRGRFQQDNALTALAAAALVRDRFGIDAAAARTALENVCWPGRLEVVSREPLTVVDGAHNEAGVTTLLQELPEIVGDRPLHLLFAVMRDKRWQPMVDRLGGLVRSATVTTVLPPRGEAPEPVAAAFRRYCSVQVEPDSRRAWTELWRRIPPGEAILVTGSLFLVGSVYPLFGQGGARIGPVAHA